MVLSNIFSRSSSPDKPDKQPKSKSHKTNKDKDKDKGKNRDKHKARRNQESTPRRSNSDSDRPSSVHRSFSHLDLSSTPIVNPPASPQPSPKKSSSPRKQSTIKSPLLSSYRDLNHSRSSSTVSKQSLFNFARSPQDHETHPLNLPPDELRRLSAMAAAMDETRSSMDVDPQETPSSPVVPQQSEVTMNGTQNGTEEERSPTPPPHRSTPQTADGGESFKLAGNKFYKIGDYDRAIEEYNKALEINPDSSIFLSNRAAAFLSANRYLEALEDAQRALDLDPGNQKILHRLARIYTNLGRPAEALDVLSRVQPPASVKDRAPAENMLRFTTQAEESLKEGKGGSLVLYCLDQARQLLGSGVKPPRKWTLMTGEAYVKIGNDNSYGMAHDVAISMLRENNQDPDALLLRAKAYYGQGDNEQALKYLKLSLGLDPDNKTAIKLLRMLQKLVRTKEDGNAAFKARDYKRAVELYTQALEIDPNNKDINSKLLQNRAQAHINLKQYDHAVEDCTEALRLDPSYIKARRIRAKANGAAGNWEEAIQDYKNVAENSPGEKGIQEDIRNAEFELKKAQRKDYYKILGVTKDANENDIKKAYRRLAIQYHPDKNRDGENNDEKFKEIGEAYETLIDSQKRAAYDNGDDLLDPTDMFGRGGFATNMGGTHVNIDPSVLFNMMNGGGGFAHAGGGHSFGGGQPFGGGQGRGGFGGFSF